VYSRCTITKRSCVAALLGVATLIPACHVIAQEPAAFTSLKAVHAISNVEAARSIPVALEGSVTYYERGNVDLFVQDGSSAIYVQTSPDLAVRIGDWVHVEGETRASFRPEIVARRVTVLHDGVPPRPANAAFPELIRAEIDCQRIAIRGVIQGASIITDGPSKSLLLDVLMAGGDVQAQVANGVLGSDARSLLDSEVEITGAAAGRFDSKSQLTGVLIEVYSLSDVRVLKRARVAPHQLPIRSFDQILQSYD
jgi:hypothetical protein